MDMTEFPWLDCDCEDCEEEEKAYFAEKENELDG